MKKQSNLSRLMGYAGGHKILTYLSWILSVMSALLALVPFWYIWRIVHDILEMSPDFSLCLGPALPFGRYWAKCNCKDRISIPVIRAT